MKFAKLVFRIAGTWGVITLTPLYFLSGAIGRSAPPPITHPEFFYGFTGVALAWQSAFFLIAADPVRFRPIMIPAVLEKLSYVLTVVVMYLQRRMNLAEAIPAIPDSLLCLLFTIAFFRTGYLREAKAKR